MFRRIEFLMYPLAYQSYGLSREQMPSDRHP